MSNLKDYCILRKNQISKATTLRVKKIYENVHVLLERKVDTVQI